MGGLEVFGVAVVVVLMLCISFAKSAARSDQQSRATAKRLAMQNRDFRWPRRES